MSLKKKNPDHYQSLCALCHGENLESWCRILSWEDFVKVWNLIVTQYRDALRVVDVRFVNGGKMGVF